MAVNVYGTNQVTATWHNKLFFVGLHAELFIFRTCDCNSKFWYTQYTVNVVIMNSMKIKL